MALVFTGDEFADGGTYITSILQQQKIKASFFFTGRFYDNKIFKNIITDLKRQGHYLGPHSYGHLLYCDWGNRDSLLVTEEEFAGDLLLNLRAMSKYGIESRAVHFFIPPYEWYNNQISDWAKKRDVQVVNFTPGTKSTSDYTTPGMNNYQSSQQIWESIVDREKNTAAGLNGYILLLHVGTDPRRTDKFYHRLPQLITLLKEKGYHFVKIDELLKD